MTVQAGRYGPYAQHGSLRATLPKGEEMDDITLERAIELLNAKAEKSGKGAPKKASGKKTPAKKSTAKKADAKADDAKADGGKPAAKKAAPKKKASAKKAPAKKTAAKSKKAGDGDTAGTTGS